MTFRYELDAYHLKTAADKNELLRQGFRTLSYVEKRDRQTDVHTYRHTDKRHQNYCRTLTLHAKRCGNSELTEIARVDIDGA